MMCSGRSRSKPVSRLSKQQQRRIVAQRENRLAAQEAGNVATVVCHLGYHLVLERDGMLFAADWRRQSGDVVCNDQVLVQWAGGRAVVEAVLPRRNVFCKWQGRGCKAVAANLDQLLVVIAVEPAWQENLVDRYLIAARQAGITAAILLNKLDLLEEAGQVALRERLVPYVDLAVLVFYASVADGSLPPELQQWLRGRQTMLCGQSGVGKSSLIRALKPDVDVWVRAISDATGHGRHTTTNLRRYPLDEKSALIDTPGVRGLGLHHLDHEAILRGFPDIAGLVARCRFADCNHRTAPDCAVLAALESGNIHAARYHSFLQLWDERT